MTASRSELANRPAPETKPRVPAFGDTTAEAAPARAGALLKALHWACVALTLLLGLAKVERQRDRLPSWADRPENSYQGYVAIDGHAHRAGVLLAWMRGEAGASAAVRQWFVEDGGHPTTLVPPALVAAVALATGSVPHAFLIVNALALLACCVLVRRLAARIARATPLHDLSEPIGWLSATCFVAHCLTVRTALQLNVDHCAAAAALLVCDAGLAYASGGRARHAVVLLIGALAGVFTKLSFLPALAAGPLAALCLPGTRWRELAVTLACGALPFAAAVAWLLVVCTPGSATGDFAQHLAAWRLGPAQLAAFALEMALLFQCLPWAWRGIAWLLDRPLLWLAAVAATLLVANWSFRLPATPRLYVAPEALVVVLSVHGLIGRLGWGRRSLMLAAGRCAANYAFAAAANLGFAGS